MKETLNNSAFPKRFFSVSGYFSGQGRDRGDKLSVHAIALGDLAFYHE